MVLEIRGFTMTEKLKALLDNLPARPGVYLFKSDAGKILYVGKAINLRSRVRSYFTKAAQRMSPKVRHLVDHVANIDFIVTESELEALILEMNLIKRYRPRYNVRLKDDKRYPYIKVTWQDDFPKVYVTRRMQQDGARYYGPFTHVWAVHETLHTLRKVFPYMTCDRTITGQDERACLYYDIGLCLAPCIGVVDREAYRSMIRALCDFLEGKTENVVTELRQEMMKAAGALEFEQAAAIRNKLQAIERVIERQKVVSSDLIDQDVIALARDDGQACVQVFFIRNGKLIGREYFMLEGAEDEDIRNVMTSFVKQFYDEAASIPPQILIQEDIDEEVRIIEAWLRNMRGDKVAIRVPQGGQDEALVEMAAENAAETLSTLSAQWQLDQDRQVTAIAELQEALALDRPPTRIECYDISNIQGTAATGSMVVFAKGAPRKSDYRRFKIRTVAGADDYAMMQEVIRRRFRRLVAREKKGVAATTKAEGPNAIPETDAWSIAPDLVIIDGGKGQLNAALEVMQGLGVDHIPIIGLAKKKEEIFKPGESDPLVLPRDSSALFLVQRIRDEAHRFALNYHRRLRRKQGISSVLEEIPGIGPKRRQALLKTFGSIEGIRQASVDELAAVPGMTRTVAEQIKAYL